ncbi:MAG: aminopeptidase P family protein [Gemmatimonadetes bacterium]|nr:aminopeptidase P family protein [Gemmatimonadota bacterium]
MITPELLPRLQAAIADAGVDGWLLFNFRGCNPIATGLLGLKGMLSRRIFVWIPARGSPVAITHAIEQGPWVAWPAAWSREVYSSWRALEALLAAHVQGRRVAMEYSPGDAVPYLDRVPAGALEMVRAAGAIVASSGELVSRFYAAWTPAQVAVHERTAGHLARIAREAFARIGASVRAGAPLAEHQVAEWIVAEFTKAGLEFDHGPDVSATENAANPHYAPSAAAPRPFRPGDLVLIDLFAADRATGIIADQTWMASIGTPSARVREIWAAVRDARDAAIALLRDRLGAGGRVSGAEADDAARAVITQRGYGPYFTHRTGHSIDARDIHGSGPNLDNLETRDDRLLIPGVCFSIEPGIYLTGELGMRSEVNAVVRDDGLLVTPREVQHDLIVL